MLSLDLPGPRFGPAGSGAQELDRLFRGFCGVPLARAAGFAQTPVDQVLGRHISGEFTTHPGAHCIFGSAVVPSTERARTRWVPQMLKSTNIRVMAQSKYLVVF